MMSASAQLRSELAGKKGLGGLWQNKKVFFIASFASYVMTQVLVSTFDNSIVLAVYSMAISKVFLGKL